jgi:cytidylate kinase
MIVAIDGPAGSGKSTTARNAASTLGFVHIDTGAMYRALTLAALRRAVPLDRDEALTTLAHEIHMELGQARGVQWVKLDGEDVTTAIRGPEVDLHVSRVSEVPGVRTEIVRQQRLMAGEQNVVMEGRDIATVVFPEAEVKIFLVADIEERARRRQDELKQRGVIRSAEDVQAELRRRDEYDSSRAVAPLKAADDAVELNTTNLTIDEQVARVVALARAYEAHRCNHGASAGMESQ